MANGLDLMGVDETAGAEAVGHRGGGGGGGGRGRGGGRVGGRRGWRGPLPLGPVPPWYLGPVYLGPYDDDPDEALDDARLVVLARKAVALEEIRRRKAGR